MTAEAQAQVIESFILREGTDYGLNDVALEQKARQIRTQIEKGLVKLVYDPAEDSVTLITREDLKKLLSHFEC